jgi:hypothetical protein
MTNELWKPAFGFEDFYVVSNLGNAARIRNQGNARRPNWKQISTHPVHTGYVRFCFCIENHRKFCLAHRAVWEAFNGPIPKGMQINHKNGNKSDNRLSNLEVCTQSQNTIHSYRVLNTSPNINPNPGSRNGRAKLTESDIPSIRKMLKNGDSKSKIAAQFNVSPAMIWMIETGRNWRHVPAAN